MTDTFDPKHIRDAVALLDAPGIHPEVALMIRAHAEKVLPPEWREDIAADTLRQATSVVRVAPVHPWPAPPPRLNRAQRRAARRAS
jgi:hypothetical protein